MECAYSKFESYYNNANNLSLTSEWINCDGNIPKEVFTTLSIIVLYIYTLKPLPKREE